MLLSKVSILLYRDYTVARVRQSWLASGSRPTPSASLLDSACLCSRQPSQLDKSLTPRHATPTSPVADLVGVPDLNSLPYSPFHGI